MYLAQLVHFWKSISSLGKGLWCLHRWHSSYTRMLIWFSVFGTEWVTKVIGTHCMIHWQILAMKTMPQELQEVMRRVISSVNFVKASKQPIVFITAMSWMHQAKLSYFRLKWDGFPEERAFFFQRKGFKTSFWASWWTQNIFNQKWRPQFESLFSNNNELQQMAYLVDTFTVLNKLSLALQGPNAACRNFSEQSQAFQRKLQLWQKEVE